MYAAFSAESFDSLMPSMPVANLRAAGDIDARCSIDRTVPKRGVRLSGGVSEHSVCADNSRMRLRRGLDRRLALAVVELGDVVDDAMR